MMCTRSVLIIFSPLVLMFDHKRRFNFQASGNNGRIQSTYCNCSSPFYVPRDLRFNRIRELKLVYQNDSSWCQGSGKSRSKFGLRQSWVQGFVSFICYFDPMCFLGFIPRLALSSVDNMS